MLNLTVLVENSVMPISPLLGEHGLSMMLTADDRSFLWDTGATDICVHNATKCGIDLREIDTVVFSHYHYDHVGGLKSLPPSLRGKRKVIAQKYAFYPRIDEENKLASPDIPKKYEVTALESGAYDLTPSLVFLAGIPRVNDFEGKHSFGRIAFHPTAGAGASGNPESIVAPEEGVSEDFVPDDSALIALVPDGFVIVTGCSHSGICNIVHHAKEVAFQKWNVSRVKSVIGGLHLIQENETVLEKTLLGLKAEGVEELGPCHCTDLAAKLALASAGFRLIEITSGTKLVFG